MRKWTRISPFGHSWRGTFALQPFSSEQRLSKCDREHVERLRPQSLEPFRLDASNPSGELWMAEGFTSYYEPLTMHRAGFEDIDRFAARLGQAVDAVIRSPAL